VLGCGIDVPYPQEHAALSVDIAMTGCLVSEFPLGTPPCKYNFPQRNRILSGLSLGTVVVEAGIKSGAMGTARWAVEQNREVFAVPGPIEHHGSRGPHRLIREGAHLVEGITDILSELPPCGTSAPMPETITPAVPSAALSSRERAVLSTLELNPKHIDELVEICHISSTSILPILLKLEMRGLVESCGGGLYALAAIVQ
jgi:DNA processing protein